MSNTGSAPLYEMNDAIRAILYNQPYNFPTKSLAVELHDIYTEKGAVSGTDFYKKINNDTAYRFSESEMNSVGYELLKSGKKKEAIEIFKIITEVLPKSGNAFDSLGEAYLADGNKKLAIANYSKSVALDPTNEDGKKILQEISKKKSE